MAPVVEEREEWLVARNSRETGYIGASEVAAVLGISPFDSPHDIWLSKVRGAFKEETLAMRRGRHMEPFIADEFTRETGIACNSARLIRHPKWPYIAANLDREFSFMDYRCVLECKDVGYWPGQEFGEDGADCVADHYLTQVAYQLIPDRHDFACLCVLIDGRELRKYWYTFKPHLNQVDLPGSTAKKPIRAHALDPDMATSMVSAVSKFWERHIVRGIEPPLSHTDSDCRYVKRERATYENGQLTNSDARIDKEAVLLRATMRTLKKYEEVAERRKNRLKLFMTERKASKLETTVGTFSWQTNAAGVTPFNTPFRSGKY